MPSSSLARHLAKAALVGTIATTLTLGLAPTDALAESLEQLEQKAIDAGERYQASQGKLDGLNKKIEDNQSRIDELESELPALRERCSVAVKSSYKIQMGQSSLLSLVLSADDFNEFITMLTYMDAVNEANTEDIARLGQAETDLKNTRATLEESKKQAEAEAAQAAQAAEEARATADAAHKKAMEEAAAKKAAYEARQRAEAQRKAEAEKATADAEKAAQSEDGPDTEGSPDAGNTIVTEPTPSNGSSSAAWNYVMASTYGEGDGFMWGTTASGDTVTPTSMGVAMKTVPLGTTIQITCNGRTCNAVVNDRGPFVAGREIDLQPAVAHALGFDGVGQVGYRIVG